MRLTSLLVSTLLLATAACTTDNTPAPADVAGDGVDGKGDGTSPRLYKLTRADEAQLLAFDADCRHETFIDTYNEHVDGYLQAVRLMCFPRGGHLAPQVLFVGVVSPGEGGVGAARDIYKLPAHHLYPPDKVVMKTVGAKSTITFEAEAAVFMGDKDFEKRLYTVTVEMSGPPETPKSTATMSWKTLP